MYDKQQVFKTHIKKKAEELNELCKTLGVASFMTFCVKDDGVNTTYQNYIYGSASNKIKLVDDQICRHVNVSNGFTTLPPDGNLDIDDYMGED